MSVTISGNGQIIKQVIQTTYTSATTASPGAYTWSTLGNVLSATITPTNANNKILILAQVNMLTFSSRDAQGIGVQRNGSNIYVGDVAGSRLRLTSSTYNADNDNSMPVQINYIDSPATTSATTYTISFIASDSNAVGINRSYNDSDGSGWPRSASSIILMEVAYA